MLRVGERFLNARADDEDARDIRLIPLDGRRPKVCIAATFEQNLQSWWDKSGMKGGTIGLLKVVVELMLNAAECPMVRVGHASPFLFNDHFLASDSQQRVELDHPVSRGQVAGSAVQPAWQNVFNRSGWCGQPVGGS